MTSLEERLLENAIELYERNIRAIANGRLSRMAKWFRQKFPHHTLQIMFGNGDELILVDGRTLHIEERGANLSRLRYQIANGRYAPCLDPVVEAVKDVWQITDGYKVSCPDDVKVERKRI